MTKRITRYEGETLFMTTPTKPIPFPSVDFRLGVATIEGLPLSTLPEIAFAGRSNVGKSSLINAVTGRTSLARTSSTPGRTRELNFFEVKERLFLVDMPGYGYAKAPKKEIKVWQQLIRDYLRGRVQLRRVFVLVDSRHGLKDTDSETLTMLDECAVPYQILLTKVDELKGAEREARKLEVEKQLVKRPAALPEAILTSTRDRLGIEELRETLLSVASC
jgi:GTP-binding protein